MKKTIHVINAMQVGGVEVGVLSLLKSTINNNYEVVTVKGCDKNIYNSLSKSEQSRLHICNNYFSAFLLLIKLKPDLVISSLWRAHFVCILYKLFKFDIKVAIFIHNSSFIHFIDSFISRVLLNMSNYIFCDSMKTQDWLNNISGINKSFVIPMNISFSNKMKKVNFNPISFVFFGRYSKQKNLYQTIDFIKLLEAEGLNVTLDLYGRDDGELTDLLAYVDENGLSDIINFHDSILPNNVEKIMRNYNYYLQTSLFEGMSISVYQSIKNGLLPVVTPVGEIPKYTINGVNAFYLNLDCLISSAQNFTDTVRSGEIKKYDVGHIVNVENYPDFDISFFSKVNEIINLKKEDK